MSAESGRPSTLELNGAKVLERGTVLGPFTASSSATRVALLGDFTWWFALLTGEQRLHGGSATLMGTPLAQALALGVAGLVPRDAALPASWTTTRYLTESAELLGRGKAFARAAVKKSIALLELEHLATRPLAALRLAERRVLLLAAATLSEPAVLCCDSPLFRLDEDAANYVEQALLRASVGRHSIVACRFTHDQPREQRYLDRCERWLVLNDGTLAEASPGPSPLATPHVQLSVAANSERFEAALLERGLCPRRLDAVDVFRLLTEASVGGEAVRFVLALPDQDAQQAVFEAAREALAPIVEFMPMTAGTARQLGAGKA